MYKSKLQELCQKKNWDLPVYATVKDGPNHCPCFTTIVTVQGREFESPKNICKSSKESHNLAAKMAFDHFNSAQSQLVSSAINPPSPVALPSPGFVEVRSAKNNSLLQKLGQNAQTSLADQSLISCRDEIRPTDLHVYKNRLQHYAQKKSLSLPEYSCEIDGPPHARQFRASVKIGGCTYTSPAYFCTLKDSEHAAAKVAFESLSVVGVQEDEGLYKTLLQELAQKKGFQFPSYKTVAAGPPHMRTFISTVEIGGESFEGRECKTKKLSEMNAAKIAYSDLMERETSSYFSPGDNKKGNTEVRAGISQLITSHGSRGANNATETHVDLAAMGIGEIHSNYSVISTGDLKYNAVDVSTSSLDSVVTYDLQQDIQPKSIPSVNENDRKAKGENRHLRKCEDMRYMFEQVPCVYALPDGPSSYSERSTHGLEESDAEKPTGVCTACGSKIVVHPRKSTIKIPEGATILPYSDDKWVAAKVEAYQQQ